MQQPESNPVASESIASASSSGSPWIPYSTTKHRVTKGRYITSNDPRGYIPVYEYPLNNQWVMMDVDDGYVLWTGIWKADIVKMIESQPELESQLRRVRGGYLKIQGTWMPYEVALRLARRVAWPIRHDLVPLFGPTFPSTCLSPDQPGYGQVLDNAGRRRKRGPNAAARAAAAALRNQQHLHGSLTQIPHRGQYGDYRHHYPPPPGYYGYPGAPPDEYAGYPPPRGHSPYNYDAPPATYGPSACSAPPGEIYGYPPPAPYSGPPGRGYPPAPPPPGDYAFPPPRNDVMGQSAVGFNRRGPSDSRTRYTPYPVPISPTQSHPYPPAASGAGSYHSSNVGGPSGSNGQLDLPPISTIALGPSVQRDGSGPPGSAGVTNVRPMLERSLPPIESMSREGAGMPPSMDTAAVLRRLRLEEGSTHSPTSNGAGSEVSPQGDAPPRSALTPLGIARRESGGPSEQYLQTRRRSASAPPPALPQALSGISFSTPGGRDRDHGRGSERGRGAYSRRREMAPGEYPASPPSRYRHAYSHSGGEQYPPPPGSAGPTRSAYHQHHERHHPYASGSTSRSSVSSSHWTKQRSPSFDRDAITGPDEPVSPVSSVPPSNPYTQSMYAHYQQTRSPPRSPPASYPSHHHGTDRFPSSSAAFVGITRHSNDDRFEEIEEDDETAGPCAPHSSSFVRGEAPRSPPLRRGSDDGFDNHRKSSAMRHYDSNASSRAGNAGGSGLDALARAAASASASQASMSPPHKPNSPMDTASSRRQSDPHERDDHADEKTRAPVRPW